MEAMDRDVMEAFAETDENIGKKTDKKKLMVTEGTILTSEAADGMADFQDTMKKLGWDMADYERASWCLHQPRWPLPRLWTLARSDRRSVSSYNRSFVSNMAVDSKVELVDITDTPEGEEVRAAALAYDRYFHIHTFRQQSV